VAVHSHVTLPHYTPLSHSHITLPSFFGLKFESDCGTQHKLLNFVSKHEFDICSKNTCCAHSIRSCWSERLKKMVEVGDLEKIYDLWVKTRVRLWSKNILGPIQLARDRERRPQKGVRIVGKSGKKWVIYGSKTRRDFGIWSKNNLWTHSFIPLPIERQDSETGWELSGNLGIRQKMVNFGTKTRIWDLIYTLHCAHPLCLRLREKAAKMVENFRQIW